MKPRLNYMNEILYLITIKKKTIQVFANRISLSVTINYIIYKKNEYITNIHYHILCGYYKEKQDMYNYKSDICKIIIRVYCAIIKCYICNILK